MFEIITHDYVELREVGQADSRSNDVQILFLADFPVRIQCWEGAIDLFVQENSSLSDQTYSVYELVFLLTFV